MHEFEAKYKMLAAAADPKHVEAADLLVRKAIYLSVSTVQPLCSTLEAMLTATLAIQRIEENAQSKRIS